MRASVQIRVCLFAPGLIAFVAAASAATPLGTGFTYQGQLKQDGTPVTGTVDLQVSLWDAAGTGNPPVGGTQIGITQTVVGIQAANGLFTAELNGGGQFGASAFNGEARWLEIAVRSPSGEGAFTTLAPRQWLTAMPYALTSLGLRLPFNGTGNGTSPTLSIGNIGEGSAGRFKTTNPTNVEPTLVATTNTYAPAVYAEITNVFGSAAAVEGWTQSNSGTGVLGFADASAGSAEGVVGISKADSGRGVVGVAFSLTGDTRAVQADNWSSEGTGVFAEMIASTGFTRGVYGWNHSSNGTGVYGYADSPAGRTYGVIGKADSPDGYAGFFEGRAHFLGGSVGIGFMEPWGDTKLMVTTVSSWPAIYAENHSASGSHFLPTGPAGVYAVVASDDSQEKRGVSGTAAGSAGSKFGVYGQAVGGGSNIGVYGAASAGSSNFGGYFVGDGHFSGRLGVGTTTPAAALHLLTLAPPPTGLPASQNGLLLGVENSSGYKWIQSYGGPLVLNPLGNGLGIGTTTPADELHVHTSGGDVAVRLTSGGSWPLIVKQTAASDSSLENGGAERVVIKPNGNVGIGTSAPGEKLHVAGNIRASGSVIASCGTLTCSDARFKKNVRPLRGALEKIEKLNGVSYDWRRAASTGRRFGGDRQVGLIAQEVREVLPEVVHEDSHGYLSLDYGRLTPLLIEAIKEMQVEKDARIAQQQRTIEDLAARLEHVERFLMSDNCQKETTK